MYFKSVKICFLILLFVDIEPPRDAGPAAPDGADAFSSCASGNL